MGVYPYITAQIILQLLTPIFPALQRKMEEDPREGRKWQEKWTYYLAVPMAALSALGQINLFNSYSVQGGQGQIVPFGFTSSSLAFFPDPAVDHGRRNDVCHLAGRIDLRVWHSRPGSFADHLCRYCRPHAGQLRLAAGR